MWSGSSGVGWIQMDGSNTRPLSWSNKVGQHTRLSWRIYRG
jgi:hypothetical protein